MAISPNDDVRALLSSGDGARRRGDLDGAISEYAKAVELTEVPAAAACIALARAHADTGAHDDARGWALRTVDAEPDFAAWDAAARLVDTLGVEPSEVKRRIRVAVLGTYTTTYLTRLLKLVAARRGIAIEMYEAGYDQLRTELFDPASGFHAFGAAIVVLAVDAHALGYASAASTAALDVDAEADRWRACWARASDAGASIVQHNFVVPADLALAHLDASLPASPLRTLTALNAALATDTPANVRLVDCERLAGGFGKQAWFDPLWWDRAKLAVSLPATPLLAQHTVAVIAGLLGLARKCLVVDLDNTLWGGVIGEDGLAGIKLGEGDAAGEGFVAFQHHLLALKQRGVVLAACSKNDDHVAREPFEQHPEMRLHLDDFAAFVANWSSKTDNLRQIASDLSLGTDAMTFVDDNPVERQAVRQILPEVDVITLPPQPSLYARTVAAYPWFETGTLTAEDLHRTEQYRARAQVQQLERTAASLDDFYRDLRMVATISPFTDTDLPRIAQLIGKTNQFNVTTRRHDLGALQAMVADDRYIHFSLRLRDRFVDNGLVGVVIARRDDTTLDIDTWLMSCRVIGRTAEQAALGALARAATARGCDTLRGTYLPTAKNGLVRELFPSLGFELEASNDGETTWRRAVDDAARAGSPFIEIEEPAEDGVA